MDKVCADKRGWWLKQSETEWYFLDNFQIKQMDVRQPIVKIVKILSENRINSVNLLDQYPELGDGFKVETLTIIDLKK